MSKYNTFLTFYLFSVAAFIFFMIFYMNAIFTFITHANDYSVTGPGEVLKTIFSPPVIASCIILCITTLVYKILGIVYVAKSKVAKDGEKTLWIVGFCIMGFITGILFLIMAKDRKLVE